MFKDNTDIVVDKCGKNNALLVKENIEMKKRVCELMAEVFQLKARQNHPNKAKHLPNRNSYL